MGRFVKIIIPAAILVILGVVIYKPYHSWAREHVNNLTATDGPSSEMHIVPPLYSEIRHYFKDG